jgi:hypothetical protein
MDILIIFKVSCVIKILLCASFFRVPGPFFFLIQNIFYRKTQNVFMEYRDLKKGKRKEWLKIAHQGKMGKGTGEVGGKVSRTPV